MKTQTYRLLGILIIALLALAACTANATPSATESTNTDTAQPTEAPAQAAEPTAEMAEHTEEHAETPAAEPVAAATEAAIDEYATTANEAEKIDPVAFHQAMRDLWMDHVVWTRLYIVSAIADLPDTQLTAERLLQNQADMGAALGAFYGEEAGAALTELLNAHILTAADLITAAKAGDQAGIDAASAAWYANADEIAAFLAAANPAWPEDVLQEMMTKHLDDTLDEAVAQLGGDYATSISKYDEVVDHIIMMADALSSGIMTQFPEKFGEPSLNESQLALSDALRDLWMDHVVWTRLYIVSAIADLPDTQLTAERLLQNQADMGAAVGAFYGEEAGVALTELLNAHILTAADLITAAKSGDQAGIDAASESWYANADEIAAFLAGANPAWPEDVLQEMMTKHLDDTLSEATAQLTGDYATSIHDYDHVVDHIIMMADALSSGIMTQFPEQFGQ